MGSFNGTCFLTQMPIHYGDKIRLIFITKNPTSPDYHDSGFCYSSDMYGAYGLPLKGIYNDYGSIDKIEKTASVALLTDAFKAHCQDRPKAAGKGWDREEFETSKIDLDYIFDKIHDGAVKISNDMIRCIYAAVAANSTPDEGPAPKLLNVGYVMCLEESYLALLGVTLEGWNGSYNLSRYKQDGRNHLAKAKSKAQDLKNMKEFVESLDPSKKDTAAIVGALRLLEERTWDDSKNVITNHVQCLRGPYNGLTSKDILRQINQTIMKDGESAEDPKTIALMDELAEFAYFCDAMEYGRKAWLPQSGGGSQNTERAVQVALAKTVLALNRARNREEREEE